MSDYRRSLAWKAGRKAAIAGKSENANNRQSGTIFYDDWCDGWNDGLRERELSAWSDAHPSSGITQGEAA